VTQQSKNQKLIHPTVAAAADRDVYPIVGVSTCGKPLVLLGLRYILQGNRMVFPHNTFDAETAKAWVGEGGMKQYFKVIPKPKPSKPQGCPPKRKARSTNTPPTELNSAAPVPAPVTALDTAEGAAPAVARFVVVTENEQKKKTSRTNWGTREPRIKLEKALNDWSKKEGGIFDENGEIIDDWKVFPSKVDIPADTFYKYIKPNNPRQIGDGSHGKKRLMTDDEIKFTGCILARNDRVNDGLSTKEALDLVQEMIPDITRKAARNAMYRNILPLNHALGVLKRTTQKVQEQPQAIGPISISPSSTVGIT
jgi:hypothetical protein